MSLEEALEKCEQVSGWIRPKERVLLYELAFKCGGNVVEIGSWKGKSTVIMAQALKDRNDGSVLYAVDPFEKPPEMSSIAPEYDLWTQQSQGEHYTEFLENIKRQEVEEFVVPIKAMSEKAVEVYKEKYNQPVGFLFIDGCHFVDYVQKDFDLWSPFVSIGGYVGFHDAWDRNEDFDQSAAIVAKREIKDSPRFEHGQVNSLVYGKRLK